MKGAFVTGGTGFVGLNLVEALCNAGWGVTALHRPGASVDELAALGASLVEGDILDPPSLSRAIPRGIDAVFHVAGSLDTWAPLNDRQQRINVDGTRNVVAAALAADCRRLVHVSSLSTFGDQPGPIDEETPQLGGKSWINYERTKWLAEQEVRDGMARGLEAVIVCPCAILGPRDRHGWARLFSQLRDRKVPASPPGGATFNDVRAVAEGLVAAAERGGVGELYLLPGEDLSFDRLLRAIAAELGVAPPKRVAPRWMLVTLARVADVASRITRRQPDMTPEMASMVCGWKTVRSTKAERDLGYRARPVLPALRDSIEWLRARGLL